MKEHPIIFNTENVKAILEGRKTQTRRVIKPQPLTYLPEYNQVDMFMFAYPTKYGSDTPVLARCPYGQVGDRLWVRESFLYCNGFRYKATDNDPVMKYKPAIFMPRWASRITLEITRLRVERINDISYNDARTEGFLSPAMFHEKWDSLNAKRGYGWKINPWVWVIEFGAIGVREI